MDFVEGMNLSELLRSRGRLMPDEVMQWLGQICLLYTSDAADERSSVDLGGRRIIKKKTNNHNSCIAPSNTTRQNMTRLTNTSITTY